MMMPADDPDLEHLLQLFSMLPGPHEDRPFWDEVQARAGGTARPGWDGEHVIEKMCNVRALIHDWSPLDAAWLARQVLIFFSSDDPALWKALDRVTNQDFSLPHDHTGRWWAKDACETAWRVYVRWTHRPSWALKSLEDKWRYEEHWRELLRPVQLRDTSSS